jgi:hypothetical protein
VEVSQHKAVIYLSNKEEDGMVSGVNVRSVMHYQEQTSDNLNND